MVLFAISLAMATPPDALHVRMVPLCRGGNRVAFLSISTGNLGSHYVAVHDVAAVMLDASGPSLTTIHHGTVDNQYINSEPGGPPDSTYQTQKAPSLAKSLEAWGVSQCMFHDEQRFWRPEEGAFAYQVQRDEKPQLTLHLGDQARKLEAMFIDPRPDEWWHPAKRIVEGKRPIEPATVVASEWGQVEVAEYGLEDWQLIHLEVKSDDQSTVFALVEKPEALAAKSWLVNARGLGLHRKGDFTKARGWFRQALVYDAANMTARYNLACAHARHADVNSSIEALKAMPTEGLKTKVANDADFDPIRKEDAFREFINSLP